MLQKIHTESPSEKTLQIVRLTPAGRGAVASLLLSGSGACGVFLRHWIRKNPLPSETLSPEILPANKPFFGKIRLNNNGQTEVYEEAVVHFISPEEIEIHCHGGTAVVESVEKVFLAEGAIKTGWIEHFCGGDNQHGDNQRSAALRMLPFAETERTAQILLSQMNGALEKELKEIEILPDENEKQRRLERLRNKKILGPHLIKPFSVVLAGEVNAGKSSLLNAILGFQRVITDSLPGTTRDTVSVKTAVNGFLFEFSDTAGFRSPFSQTALPPLIEPIEQEGIKHSVAMLAECDLFIWVIDNTLEASEQPFPPEVLVPERLQKLLLCFNKIDLLSESEPLNLGNEAVCVSAATGAGIDLLLRTVFKRLIPSVPEAGEGVPLPVISACDSCR